MSFLHHLSTQSFEAVIYLEACASAALHVDDFRVLSLEFFYLSTGDFFSLEVAFVPNHHDSRVDHTRIHFNLLNPFAYVIKRRLSSEVKDAHEALSTSWS